MKKYYYIYNIKQAEFYIKNGVAPEEIGINPKTKTVFFKFDATKSQNVYDLWCNKRN